MQATSAMFSPNSNLDLHIEVNCDNSRINVHYRKGQVKHKVVEGLCMSVIICGGNRLAMFQIGSTV